MPGQDTHLTDELLLMELEGELSPREARKVKAHVEACWQCRSRRLELEQNIASDDIESKLEALAGYLRDNPGVRVSIDGYTDSRGSDAHNQDLSERRAASVRAAFDQMGVTAARFRVRGHGEADPVAPNTTAENMHRNRRVEITLLGQHASALG